MRAMVLEEQGKPLVERSVDTPSPGPREVLMKVSACAVCRTDLHVCDGDLENPKLPLIPGHEIVGEVVAVGEEATLEMGARVGVPWLGWTCGECEYCSREEENLCPKARYTGYTRDGGFAEFVVADERYCFPLAEGMSDAEAAPLLCAGLIGYRSYRKTGKAKRLGLYGFGAAAHILAQVASAEGRRIFAFTRPGDEGGQEFAKNLGAEWAGGSDKSPPEQLDAAIIFAPVGELVPKALESVRPGGVVVCAGIHMSEIPAFPYKILWEERTVCSVANLTRRDGEEFLKLAPTVPVQTEVTTYPLEEANRALQDLKSGRLEGAAVLTCGA